MPYTVSRRSPRTSSTELALRLVTPTTREVSGVPYDHKALLLTPWPRLKRAILQVIREQSRQSIGRDQLSRAVAHELGFVCPRGRSRDLFARRVNQAVGALLRSTTLPRRERLQAYHTAVRQRLRLVPRET
jgi:hypothetical protein